MYSDNK